MKSTPRCFHNDRVRLCTAIYEAKRAYVLAIARSLAGHSGVRSLAEDITQIVFLRFHQRLMRGGFADVTLANWTESDQHLRMRAWFFGTTLRVVQEFARRNRRDFVITFDQDIDDHAPAVTELTPLQKLLIEEVRQRCSSFQVVILDLQGKGFTSREIAERVGKTPTTVRGHLLNARRRMQAYLDSDDGDGPLPGLM